MAEGVPGKAGETPAAAGPDAPGIPELPEGRSKVPDSSRAYCQPAVGLYPQGIPSDSQRLGRSVHKVRRFGGDLQGTVPEHSGGIWDVPGIPAVQIGAAGENSADGGPLHPHYADLLSLWGRDAVHYKENTWRCPKCGAVHRREANAAKNIKAQGLARYFSLHEQCESA